jgi:hypothetical protein
MDVAIWSAIAAGVAAIFAAWQALEARRARTDAQAARDKADDHEQRALAAAEHSSGAASRSAEAHERLVALEEEKARSRETWAPHVLPGERWEITNLTDDALDVNAAPAADEEHLTVDEGDDPFTTVGPGESITGEWPDRLSMRRFARVELRWVDPRESGMRSALITLRRP